ncbi:Hypothetical protein FORC43_3447 [Escherichia coli]|nr:Hypothetical protein FORC43_3447 [Escherichia coli]
MTLPNPLAPVKGSGTTLWFIPEMAMPGQTRCQMMTGRAWQK